MATTWNPLDKDSNFTLSSGNSVASDSSGLSQWHGLRATDSKSSGKWYFEIQFSYNNSNSRVSTGIGTSGFPLTTETVGDDSISWGYWRNSVGTHFNHNATNSGSPAAIASGDIVQVAWDADAGKLWFGHNGTWQTGDPAAGTSPAFSSVTGTLFPMASCNPQDSSATFTGIWTSAALQYTIPTGFTLWAPSGANGSFAVTEAQDTAALSITSYTAASFALTETADSAALTSTVAWSVVLSATEAQDTAALGITSYTTVTFVLTDVADTVNISVTDVDVTTFTLSGIEALDTIDFEVTPVIPPITGSLLVFDQEDNTSIFGGLPVPAQPFFAAVGQNGTLLKSIDGITWTSISTGVSTDLYCIAQSGVGGTWVMMGSGGSIYTSTDFDNWTTRSSPVSTTLTNAFYNGSYWIAVGASGKILKSTDGSTWSVVFTGSGSQTLNRVRYANNLWVVVGNSGRIYTSPDGTTWTQRTAPNSSSGLGLFNVGTRWVVSTNSAFWVSNNGTTWSSIPAPSTDPKWGLASDGSRWNTAGIPNSFTASRTTTSTTTTSWTLTTLPVTSVQFYDVVYDSSLKWCQVGVKNPLTNLSTILTSSDGLHWTARITPTSVTLRSVTAGTSMVVDYGFGDLFVTESQDTLSFLFEQSMTLGATEASDALVFSGISMGNVGMTFALTETSDVGSLLTTAVFSTDMTSLAVTEDTDTFAVAGIILTPSIVSEFSLIEVADTISLQLSQTISGSFAITETSDVAIFREITSGGNFVTIQILPATFDEIVTFGASLFDGGTLDIYTGSQPIHPSTAPTGTKIATVVLPDPAFNEAADGTATKAGTWSGTALDSGICGWFRLTSADGTNNVDGSVTTSLGDGNLFMSTTTVNVGDPVVVTTANFQFENVL